MAPDYESETEAENKEEAVKKFLKEPGMREWDRNMIINQIAESTIWKAKPKKKVEYKVLIRKDPMLAAILSFILPGLGQVYVGQILKGILLFIATAAGIMYLIFPGIIIWIFVILDAYRIANETRTKEN